MLQSHSRAVTAIQWSPLPLCIPLRAQDGKHTRRRSQNTTMGSGFVSWGFRRAGPEKTAKQQGQPHKGFNRLERPPKHQDEALTVNSKECNCEERSRVIIVRVVERQGTHHWGLQLQRVDCQLQQPSFVCVLILSLYVCSILYCMCI